MKPVVILGSGGHAKVVIDILRAAGGIKIVGCIADDTHPDRLVSGIPIMDGMDRIETLARENLAAAIGIGGWTDNEARRAIFERALACGVEIVTAIHPWSHIAPSAVIRRGSTVFPGVTIGTEAVIGQNVIVATNASVDHETRAGDHVLISAGVSIGAQVTLCDGVLVAIGATVASKLTVGRESLVAAGATVVQDVPAETRVRGVPARAF